MRESKGSAARAVVVSAVLHLGILAFLFLATLSCASFQSFFDLLHLPQSWNRIQCEKPLDLPGQPIEAVLIGPTGAPPPKLAKVKPVSNTTVPPPPSVPLPAPPTPKVQNKPLPPPPEHPNVVDQEKVVADALEKAQDAKKEQEEKQRQHQAELDALASKKQQEQKRIDELFKQLDQATAQTKVLDKNAKQAQQSLQEMRNAMPEGLPDVPTAQQRQSGNNGPHAALTDLYRAAIQNAVTQNWRRPANMPNIVCMVHIVQLPGGDVVSATVDAGCPYDEVGKHSLEAAVLGAQPLPYKGFESVFRRDLTITFKPQ